MPVRPGIPTTTAQAPRWGAPSSELSWSPPDAVAPLPSVSDPEPLLDTALGTNTSTGPGQQRSSSVCISSVHPDVNVRTSSIRPTA